MSVYHFWSQTCEPCKILKPVIADLKEEFPKVNWISVDINNDPGKLREKYEVKTVPTLVAVSVDGKIQKHSGTTAATYYRILRSI